MAKISQEDRELFREAVKNLKFVSAKKNPPKPSADIQLFDQMSEQVTPTQSLFFSRGGLQHKTLKDLRTGKIKIQAELDLHGLNTEQARLNLADFIQFSLHHHYRCVRIIHGKGEILKNHVNLWLKQIDTVLAFASAIPRQGGTGAVCVILKRV
ncbi:MAG TPA: Smr/MutS family protein [Gammaproteobacteria bacterium]|nr:Smr/MutS family protein [Gammaproteobacteria bacterium]